MPYYTSAYNPRLTTFLGKTKMTSGEGGPWPHKYWPSVESLKAYGQKTYRRQYYLSTLPRPLSPFTEGRWNKSYYHTTYQKYRRSNNNSLLKHQSKSRFTGWGHRILPLCSRSITRGHTNPIPLYPLSRLRAWNIDW